MFRCLFAGDEFALRDGGSLYCKEDNDIIEKTSLGLVPTTATIETNNNNNNNNNLSNNNHSSELGSMSGEFRVWLYQSFRCRA